MERLSKASPRLKVKTDEIMTETKEREKRLGKNAVNILQGMFMAHKNIRIYDLNNLLVRSQISSVYDEIQDLLKS